MAFKQPLYFLVIVLLSFIFFNVSVIGKLCKKFEGNTDGSCTKKACPLERERGGIPDFCKSRKFQYKCGVFYKNMPGRVDVNGTEINGDSYTWIGSLPDALDKKDITSDVRASIGDLKKGDFVIKENCKKGEGAKTGNARCFVAMSKTRKIAMDECTKTIVNQAGDQTIGDILCEKIDFYYDRGDFGTTAKPDSVRDIELSFRYSACGGDWFQIANNRTLSDGTTTSEPLEAPEKLCCQRNDGKFKFVRCDGSNFNAVCNN